jgi:uncharacterized protein YdhG (YjbR/CyaY superfamily)
MKKNFRDIDSYIKSFPPRVQKLLLHIRSIINREAPGATEGISYGMPAFKLNAKPLVYFAAFEKHIGFYATGSTHANFSNDMANYKQGKGSVQFPLDKPLPINLITRMIQFKVKEISSKK